MTYQPPPQNQGGQPFPQQGQPYYAQPGQPMYYGQPPKKKRFYQRVWFWLLAIVVMGMAGCGVIVGVAANSVDHAVNDEHTAIYEISGDGTNASVTYTTFNGDGSSGTEQQNEAAMPFSKTLTGKGDFSVYSLLGQTREDGTTITCRITIDGQVIAEQTSTGQYSVVTCSGSPKSD